MVSQTLDFESGPSGAGLRGGVILTAAGVALLGSTFTNLWTGSVVVPTALGVALLVLGTFLLAVRMGVIQRGEEARPTAIACFEGHVEPVCLTDLNGRLIAHNPAATARPFPNGWMPDPGAMLYRLTREVEANGVAIEEDEGSRIVVTRQSGRQLLWRFEAKPRRVADPAPVSDVALPRLQLDAQGRVTAVNAAAAAIGIAQGLALSDVFADLPLRADDVHVLTKSGNAARAVLLAERDGGMDLLLSPLTGAAGSGLVPAHFLEDLPVALTRLEIDGRLTYANKAARQLLGENARPGTNITDLLEGMGRSISERLLDTTRGRALGRSEVARGALHGKDIYLQVAFTRTMLDGAPTLLAVLSDATELKSLEAQFVQSQKMQAVGQLAGGVAHDFNNLLTAINGHADLLLMRHDVTDVEHGDLMQIRQNANRAAALVRQLLAFSRKQTLRPTIINLQDTLSELSHLLNRLLTDKVVLRIEHGPDLLPVRVDERQLEQVIMNLVVNARDAMPRGGEVRVTTRNVHLDQDLHRDRAVILQGDYVVIEVADSGTGIPEGKLNKIFDPFYTTKPVGEGTGLGLSTAYGIVKQTGGFIFADSPVGGGAIFTIYLPAHDRIVVAEPVEPEPRKSRDLSGRGLVLLVEDEDPVRSFAARALRLRGYTVVEASSGEEALEILKNPDFRVDIMLSDVIMPGLDGPGWVREAQKTRPDTKVIFMSGYTEDSFVGGDSGIPNAAFLPKPFTLNELTQRVKDHLDG